MKVVHIFWNENKQQKIEKLQFGKWLDREQSKAYHVGQELELGLAYWLAVSAWSPVWKWFRRPSGLTLKEFPSWLTVSPVTLVSGRGSNGLSGFNYWFRPWTRQLQNEKEKRQVLDKWEDLWTPILMSNILFTIPIGLIPSLAIQLQELLLW